MRAALKEKPPWPAKPWSCWASCLRPACSRATRMRARGKGPWT